MITVTRLNGEKVQVNADHIRFVEERPDTIISFVDGKSMMVRESVAEITERVVAFRRRCGHPGDMRSAEEVSSWS